MMKKFFGIAVLSVALFSCNAEKSNETTTEEAAVEATVAAEEATVAAEEAPAN